MASDLNGRVALVTGSAGGIGQATAVMLAQMGADMVLLDLKEGALRETAGVIAASGCSVETICLDIRDRDGVKAGIGVAEKSLGRIDILVNNAGVGPAGPGAIEHIEDHDLDRMFGVHAMGAFAATRPWCRV